MAVRLALAGPFGSIRCRLSAGSRDVRGSRPLHRPNQIAPTVPLHRSLLTLLVALGLTLAAELGVGLALPLVAQDAPLMLEVQGGAAIPLGDFRGGEDPDEGTSTGASLSVVFAIPSEGWRTIYAGFSQHRFGCETGGCAPAGRYEDQYVATGFNVGVRIVPVRDGPFIPWIRLGGITTRVEVEDTVTPLPGSPPTSSVSDLGFGGEAGAGLLVRLGRSVGWSATGLVSLVSSELPDGASMEMRYLTLHTGITLLF